MLFAPSTARLRFLAALLALVMLSVPAHAQFMNRAIWLGSEEEGFRRDFRQDAEYFVDRASYVDQPPWWPGQSSNPFRNRFSVAGGSVSSDELTLESALNLGVDVGKGFTFRAHHLGSENQTTRYQRFALGFDVETGATSSLLFQLEGDAVKARADASIGAELWRTDHSAHRVLLTAADWSDGKSDVFAYDSKPYGLLFAGYHGDPRGIRFVYDLSTQLPFEERQLASGETLEMARTIGAVELRLPLSGRDEFVVGFDGELTSKELSQVDPLSPAREDGDAARGRLRTQWWRRGADGRETTLGLWLQALDEDYVRPNDPLKGQRVRRREAMLTGGLRLPIDDAWSLEPYAIGGYVELEDRLGEFMPGDLDFTGFQGKIGAPVRYQFSEFAFLRIDLSLQLDEFAFGGGAVQFEASF